MSAVRATPDGAAPLAERAYRAAESAYREASPDWERGICAALGELLDLLAEERAQTERCVALSADSLEALGQRGALVARFVELLGPDPQETDVARPEVVAEAVGQSVVELIGSYVTADRTGELREALPTATLIALTPFVGPEQAERRASALAR